MGCFGDVWFRLYWFIITVTFYYECIDFILWMSNFKKCELFEAMHI